MICWSRLNDPGDYCKSRGDFDNYQQIYGIILTQILPLRNGYKVEIKKM